MECHISTEGNSTDIALGGQLTFSDNHKFKQILSSLEVPGLKNMKLNFSMVDFIDSAGLGMLLLLRDECEKRGIDLALESARGQVEKIFGISKFDLLFNLSE